MKNFNIDQLDWFDQIVIGFISFVIIVIIVFIGYKIYEHVKSRRKINQIEIQRNLRYRTIDKKLDENL